MQLLARFMANLGIDEFERDRARLGSTATHAVALRLLCVFRHQRLKFGFALLMHEKG